MGQQVTSDRSSCSESMEGHCETSGRGRRDGSMTPEAKSGPDAAGCAVASLYHTATVRVGRGAEAPNARGADLGVSIGSARRCFEVNVKPWHPELGETRMSVLSQVVSAS